MKHYFAGSERIATVMGDGQWIHARPIDGWYDAHDTDIALYFKYPDWPYPLGEQEYTYTVQNEDIDGRVQEELAYKCEPAVLKRLYWKMPGSLLKEVMTRYTEPHWDEREIFYYHGDHLGSASWITDKYGAPAQYLHYLPYGELYANQALSFKERFKFTGKELDDESGYYNFEARQLLSEYAIFSKVDPLADITPQLQPYLYCKGNPLRYIDQDGKHPVVVLAIGAEITMMDYALITAGVITYGLILQEGISGNIQFKSYSQFLNVFKRGDIREGLSWQKRREKLSQIEDSQVKLEHQRSFLNPDPDPDPDLDNLSRGGVITYFFTKLVTLLKDLYDGIHPAQPQQNNQQQSTILKQEQFIQSNESN